MISPKQLFSYMHACRNQEHGPHSPGGMSMNSFLLRSLAWDPHWEVPGEITGIDVNKTLGVLWNFPEDLTSVWYEKAFLAGKMCVSEELSSCQHASWLGAGVVGGEGRFESNSTQAAPSKSLFPWLWLSLHQGLDWSCLSQGSNCQRNHLVWFLVTDSQEQKSLWEEPQQRQQWEATLMLAG